MQPQPATYFQRGRSHRMLGIIVSLLSAACTGEILGSDGGMDGTAAGLCPAGNCATPPGTGAGGGANGAAAAPGDVPMRRLNLFEYRTTISDWLGVEPDVSTFPPDSTASGFDNVGSELAISPLHIESFEKAADAVVERLFAADADSARAGWCTYGSGNQAADEACAAEIVTGFSERAWRRPHSAWVGNDGLAPYLASLTPGGRFGAQPLETRLRQVLKAVLLGPRFLFRVELTDANGQLDVPSLASRLSYMLWSTAPDSQSLQSNLQDDAVLRTELNRMLFSGAGYAPKFARFLERFPDLWLELGLLPVMTKNTTLFPSFSPQLAAAMRLETQTYLRELLGLPGVAAPPLSQLLTRSGPSASDPALAALYGDSPRQGLLTQASILSVTSTESRTSAVRRGKWIMERLLCDSPPPPPGPLADAIKAKQDGADPNAVERERLAVHREEPQCNGCHRNMDIIGLAFENYDAIGAYRTVDEEGHVIDPGGTLLDSNQTFTSAPELVNALSADPRVARCVAQQLLTYGTGRTYSGADAALFDSVMVAAGGSEATLQRTLEAVALSPAFRSRQGSIQ